jgi:hypothetical protein
MNEKLKFIIFLKHFASAWHNNSMESFFCSHKSTDGRLQDVVEKKKIKFEEFRLVLRLQP